MRSSRAATDRRAGAEDDAVSGDAEVGTGREAGADTATGSGRVAVSAGVLAREVFIGSGPVLQGAAGIGRWHQAKPGSEARRVADREAQAAFPRDNDSNACNGSVVQ